MEHGKPLKERFERVGDPDSQPLTDAEIEYLSRRIEMEHTDGGIEFSLERRAPSDAGPHDPQVQMPDPETARPAWLPPKR